ncbi:XdhC family protein [Paraglaciecola aquimarina]|uniref:XdhC family protein n=1 Tax=Paraglaciecola aquimarina TaxID=1235557 RepID=A0ABU3SYS2_9ALTE|nr:XdhC family protein [Paraglaciecola aquimarina]MDU0355168.1 XdhC family protein [Paraglaciecola aquimarina]
MANRIQQLLHYWSSHKDSQQWVLATIVQTQGSSYRKSGAMMMINDLGQYYGMLSGGCLESDIMRQARRCWENNQNRIVEYDMREEEDLAWKLGIGCGGMVKILLQPVNSQNRYLQLEQLSQQLDNREPVVYQQNVELSAANNQILPTEKTDDKMAMGLVEAGQHTVFVQKLLPTPLVAIFGAGVDAKPLVSIAGELGWQIILLDPRVGYGKQGYFPAATQTIREPFDQLTDATWLGQINAAFVLTHNVKLDAKALKLLQFSHVSYLGLLGPKHRTQRVLDEARLTLDILVHPLSNPAGLRLGGELPESIALSMISEAHAVLEHADAKSISGCLA